MDLREVFATNLRRLRHAKGLLQDDLAYEAEVSRSYLSQLEKGTFYASLKILSRVLDVDPAELLRSPQERKRWDCWMSANRGRPEVTGARSKRRD
jgi:transcriptional regulator with XRE-family HTH domain